MSTWVNLFDMLDAIRRHIQATGRTVELNDDSEHKVIGFKEGSETWKISFNDVRRSISQNPNHPDIEKARTPSGRLKLVNRR